MLNLNNNVNMFIWFENGKYIQDEHGQIILDEKPSFSFQYDTLKCYWAEKVYTVEGSSETHNLSGEQHQEIEQFILNKREQTGILKLCVDIQGKYLGRKNIDDPDVHYVVDIAPPNADPHRFNFKLKQWERIYFYDADGKQVFDEQQAEGFTTKQPSEMIHPFTPRWDIENKEWILHDESGLWTKVLRERSALECLVDCVSSYLVHKDVTADQKKNLIDKMMVILIESAVDDEMNQTFVEFRKTIQDLYGDLTPFEMQNLVIAQKVIASSVNMYKCDYDDIANINVFIKLNPDVKYI